MFVVWYVVSVPVKRKGDLGECESLKELSTNRRVKGQHCQSIPSLKLCGEANCFRPPVSQLSVTGDEHSFCSDPWENPDSPPFYAPHAGSHASVLSEALLAGGIRHDPTVPAWLNFPKAKISTASPLPSAISILTRNPRNSRLLTGACGMAAVLWEWW